MLIGHAAGLPTFGSSKDMLADSVSDLEAGEESDVSEQILYMASFEELAAKTVQYDTIIWVSISLLLILAWGFGLIMLLYLPIRRYVLQKEISLRKLYVTSSEIVYKAFRPSFIPFWGVAKVERHVPLSLVIDVIIEQGCLQSAYSIHTFRVESIALGNVATVDELQVQGIYDPELLRKVIVMEASKLLQSSRSRNVSFHGIEREAVPRLESLNEGQSVLRSPAKSWKAMGSPRVASVGSPRLALMEQRGALPTDFMLNKLEEVSKTVKKIEVLIDRTQKATPASSS